VRTAALYDIHGNLPALEAVIAEARRKKIDQIVIGGDVLPGPMPRETLAFLLDLDIPVRFLRGNGEAAVLAERAGADPGIPEQAREAVRWVAEQLGPGDEEFLRSWPATLRLEIAGIGEVLFCHATPRSDKENFTRLTPEDRLLPIFEGIAVPLVVCGHTHMQFDRGIGGVRVVNAGSVGMPFGKPGADWLLLGPGIELRHTEYDLSGTAEILGGTDYPKAREFVEQYVLSPPSEEKMLEAFGRSGLGGESEYTRQYSHGYQRPHPQDPSRGC
jgi:diadenosine tetraphosphatase ApaH/serine/threonine PP2A family protein phosphatase